MGNKSYPMKYLLIGGISVVVIGGIILITLFGSNPVHNKSANTQTGDDTSEVEPVDATREVFSGQGTLASLIARAESLECSITYTAPDGPEVTGTYFVHNGQIRGDFLTTVPELGGEVLSSIIIADGAVYSWSDIAGQMYGVKVLAPETEVDMTTPDTIRAPIADDAPVSYECRLWTAIDNSIFQPPSSVLFQDMTSVLDVGMEYGTVYPDGQF